MRSEVLTTEEVLKVSKINKRSLQYWRHLKLIKPHGKPLKRGMNAVFNLENLVHIYIIRELIESGLNTKLIKNIMMEINKCDVDQLPDKSLLTNGRDFIQITCNSDLTTLTVNPLYIMRLSPLYYKAIRDIEIFIN